MEESIDTILNLRDKTIGIVLKIGEGEASRSMCKYLTKQEATDLMMELSYKIRGLNRFNELT